MKIFRSIYVTIVLNHFFFFKSYGLNISTVSEKLFNEQLIIENSNLFGDEMHTQPEVALEFVMKNYNKLVKPKGLVDVELDIRVLSFDNLDESSMKFNVDFYFSQFWFDERFKILLDSPESYINILGKKAEDLWLPDTVLVNSKSSNFHYVTVENRFTTINFSSGMILQHARISTAASCHMDLRKYPFDEQICYIAIESYDHNNKELAYYWSLDESSIDKKFNIKVYDKEMANFDVTSALKSLEKTPHHDASFSSATAMFTFRRRREYFLLQIYLPCALIVAITWISFWITTSAIPARCGISVTAMLTLITMLSITNASMPKVGYIKALDIYLLTSLIFVFMTLIEYIIALNWMKNKENVSKKRTSSVNSRLNSNKSIPLNFCGDAKHISNNNSNDSVLFYKQLNKRNAFQSERREVKSESWRLNENLMFKNLKSSSVTNGVQNNETLKDSVCLNFKIDCVARFLFPISFLAFNILYWWFYFKD
ncbi:gamma-aminobutyric acid receptor subunit delta isoform X2 [Hydra vulgaris]|uniref:Gamma-aminobutyric acid receptor subunit delta isoform X2 n=1 Tax=Hydra vulgaris TaxID=6087 RepID=A0ABM4CEW1_HYDVU